MSKEDVEKKQQILGNAARRVAHLVDLCADKDGVILTTHNVEARGSLPAAILVYRKEKESLAREQRDWLMYAVQNMLRAPISTMSCPVNAAAFHEVRDAMKALGYGPTGEAF